MKTSPIHLLLVEDNPADATLLQYTLAEATAESFHITHVERMDEAVHRLTSDSFDAILLDLSLPDSRGIDTVAQVNAVAPHVPIIVMTGLDDEATALKAVRRGAQDFLLKGQGDCRVLARAIRYAMERKQTEQQLKSLNETLEQRVVERTAVATRRAAQLQELAAELTQTEHRERRRLAQILHDHLQQLLYAARLNLGSLKRVDPQEPSFSETVDQIDALLGECIAESRALTVQLCPPVLHESGLAMALEWLGRHMEQIHGLEVEIDLNPQAEPESEEIRILLFEAARELLFNVVKHAETPCARLSLSIPKDGEVCVTVSDQGAGFIAIDDKADSSGFGLFSIRERLELMGGRLHVEAAPGRGTTVTVLAPSRNLSTSAGDLASDVSSTKTTRKRYSSAKASS
jgi:signal transduction histidine kinase